MIHLMHCASNWLQSLRPMPVLGWGTQTTAGGG